jgi:hypothetical protein
MKILGKQKGELHSEDTNLFFKNDINTEGFGLKLKSFKFN